MNETHKPSSDAGANPACSGGREVSGMSVRRYVVVENTPGYLPDDDDPPIFDEYSDAVAYLNERAAEYADDPDGNYRVEYGWASGDNYAAVMVWDDDRTHDLGRYIGVERWDGGEG